MLTVLLLGIILGILLTCVLIYTALAFHAPIKRKIIQTASSLKEKGKILEPEDEELTNWTDSLPNT